MSPKELTAQWLAEVWNRRDPDRALALLHPEFRGASAGGPIADPRQFVAEHHRQFLEVFPDQQIVCDALVAEGDLVAFRWTVTATHLGAVQGIAPTGRRVRFEGMTWFRFRDGQLIDGEDHFDFGALLAFLATGQPAHSVQPA